MQQQLSISLGQCSETGRKEVNQDFFGALIPVQPALTLKGISVVIADGISSSRVSRIAAESVTKSFLSDYYCTSDSWSVKTSALRVIRAANAWLFAQTRRSIHAHDMDRGYVCTFSALVLKSRVAHLFHVGDSRIYRLEGDSLEVLSEDHRNVVSSAHSYLARAIGMQPSVDVDYRALPLAEGDVFVLATDGVYEYADPREISRIIHARADDLDGAAEAIVKMAFANGSPDNLTLQIVRIETLPRGDASDVLAQAGSLPAPPLPRPGQVFEGYRILRSLHASHRSHVFLVEDLESGEKAALKVPSTELREDRQAMAGFMMEDWIVRRLNAPHVLGAFAETRPHKSLYTVTEYIEGQTLAQWMIDNPKCDLETMRGIVEQIARGLRAMHRKEMLHQDLRPENIMIDTAGTVKIVDFGATRIAGVAESASWAHREAIPGTMQYTAPELFLGEAATRRSDYFSLGVIAYQMLTGKLPYGARVSRLRHRKQLGKLVYLPARCTAPTVPEWVDAALRKSVHPDPLKRHDTLSEFLADLRRPQASFQRKASVPLAEKNPVAFWKALAGVFAFSTLVLLLILGASGAP